MQKNFVLDTNVLIHSDGTALTKFEENNIWIPTVVTEELDNLKERKDKPETAYAARASIRALKEFSKKGNLLTGVLTQDGGKLFLLVEENLNMELPAGWNPSKPDNMILMMTKALSERPGMKNVVLITNDGNVQLKAITLGIPVEEYRNDRVDLSTLYTGRTVRHVTDEVMSVFAASCNREMTQDEKAQYMAKMAANRKSEKKYPVSDVIGDMLMFDSDSSLGFSAGDQDCQDSYCTAPSLDDITRDSAEAIDVSDAREDEEILAMKEDPMVDDVNQEYLKHLDKKQKKKEKKKKKAELSVEDIQISEKLPRMIAVDGSTFYEGLDDLQENEYVHLLPWTNSAGFLTQYKNGHLTELHHQDDPIFGLTMLNEGQRFLKEALMKSCDEAPLVCVSGPAGTGKTLVALAAGLEQAYNQHIYDQVLLCRANIMAGGKDENIGFLPGTEQEKISPLFRGAEDAIRLLFPYQKPDSILAELMDRGVLNMQAVAYLRGRSIANSFIILDEAQNMTPNLMLMLLSRLGAGSKIVCLGDPDQVDNPHLSMRNNGLVYTIDRMKGSSLCEVITFEETECKRSPLAKEVAQRMKL